ncbi:hypothetical protein C0J52_28376, partial [Blattella germanica]
LFLLSLSLLIPIVNVKVPNSVKQITRYEVGLFVTATIATAAFMGDDIITVEDKRLKQEAQKYVTGKSSFKIGIR